MTSALRRRAGGALEVLVLASLTVLPQLLGGRGRLNADTKQYLYLDPGDLMARARVLWDARVGGGTVTHQALGYLWPMGPYYWATEQLGVPPWAAQRIWIGGIQLVAALGALVLLRHLGVPRHARLAGAVLYGLSPFVLGHVTGQSGLLLPFAALGWLVWTMALAIERGGWRWPAAFALVVTSCASLNGSSVFFVVLAATLWVPFAVWRFGHATPSQGLGALVRTGGLGQVRSLRASLGFPAPYDPAARLWAPELGGGALLDLGVYTVDLARLLLGEPDDVRATGSRAPNGVDAESSVVLRFPSGAHALLEQSLVTRMPTTAVLTGSRGWAELGPSFYAPTRLVVQVDDAEPETTEIADRRAGFVGELEEVVRCLRAGRPESEVLPLADSVATARVLDTAMRQVR